MEKGYEDEVLERWMGEVEDGLLLGPSPGKDADGKERGKRRLQSRMVERQKGVAEANQASQAKASIQAEKGQAEEVEGVKSKPRGMEEEGLRIVVIGDRLLTDTLLAHRLGLYLRPTETETKPGVGDDPRVISIHTTSLPEPRDVRFLRWVEEKLSGGKVKGGPIDWTSYVRKPEPSQSALDHKGRPGARMSLGDRWRRFRMDMQDSELRFDPRTWRPLALTVGFGRGFRWIGRKAGAGVKWVWSRARRRGAKLQTEAEGLKGGEIA